jgi:tetratricopeptide (TPR) repeat protein
MADTSIHIGDGGKRKLHVWRFLRPLLLTVAVIVVAGAAGAGLKWWEDRANPPTPQAVALYSQDKALQGDLEASQSEIDKTLQRDNLSNEDKYMLYYQKGTNFQNEGKNKEALDNFKEAVKYKQTYSLYNSMGTVAETLGDSAAAIDYYQKAIPLVGAPPENMTAAEDKKTLEIKIEQLKGQQ